MAAQALNCKTARDATYQPEQVHIMSSNQLSALLAWMKQNPSHLNWDLTLAMAPEFLNRLLLLGHFSREGSTIGDLEGEVPVPGTEVVHLLSGYRMGPPQLQGLTAEYASDKVRHAIALEGGTHLIMDKTEGLVGLALHDPLDPLWVHQELPLTADAEGVRADLKNASETELDLGGGLAQRQAAGQFFQRFLNGVVPARRVFPLVDFSALAGNPFLGIRYSALRTHVSKANGKPALVVFAGLKHGAIGDFPGEESSYPFLLPDDLQQPAATTLLLSSRLLHRAAYATGLEQMLEEGAFDAVYDDDQVLLRMDAKAGQLRSLPSEYQSSEYEFRSEAFVIPVAAGPLPFAGLDDAELNRHCPVCCALALKAAGQDGQDALSSIAKPLTVAFEDDQVRQHWASFCTLSFSFKPRKSNGWQELSATFQFDLTTLFHLVEPTPEESAGCLLLGQVLWPWQQTAEVQPVSGLPEGLSELEKQEICAFVAYLIKQAVLEGLARKLSALVPEQVLEKLSLAGAASLEHTAFEMPHGVALFANGGGTADWRIADAPHVLAAAQRHTFTVEPAGEAVSWTVEPLPGNLGDFGRIDESSGEYRAPPAHAMGGQPARLLIVATGRDSGLRSSKLLTVTLAALTVNPLIRVCYVGDELSLTAGTTAGDLQWSLADPDAEGRGTVRPEADGLRCTYIAGSPVEDNRTYVLDQVLVQSPGAGEPRTVHMLVRQRRPEMVVEVAEQLPDGSLQFQGRVAGNVVKGVRWSTPVADSGSIDPDTGHYTPPGDAGPGFVLVMARLEILDLELLFEGHLVLPLPLALHADAMRRLAQPAGLRFGKPETSGE